MDKLVEESKKKSQKIEQSRNRIRLDSNPDRCYESNLKILRGKIWNDCRLGCTGDTEL